jgi:drug/metabolite transporter (DMT)-like permease
MRVEGERRSATPAAIWTALGAVYVIWGTTYLGIRVANETLPPLIAAGVRFVIAGGVLYLWAIRRGDRANDRPARIHWRSAAIIGALLIAGGNGGVVLAERTVPSGITSLIIALVPLWMALVDGVVLRHRIPWLTGVGLVLGFGGAALLVGSTSLSGGAPLSGLLTAVLATIAWTTGSLYSRNAPLPERPLVGAGMEMLIGGVVLMAIGVLRGEISLIAPEDFSAASLLALAYLIVFGSWVGFTSYVWLLRNARTSLVSTYAYVNPLVAVFLGWLILDEAITLRTLVAGGIILVAVAIIITTGETARREQQPVEADLGEIA